MSRTSTRAIALLVLLAGCGNAPPLRDAIEERHEALLEPGQTLYWRSEYDSARAVWSAALVGARADGDSLGVARLLTWMGLAAYRSRDFAEARTLGEAALELKLQLGDERELARSYNALGMVALDEHRLLDGIRLFERARAAGAAAGDGRVAGAAAGNLGLIQAQLGDLEQAAASMRIMWDAGRAAEDPRLEANALTNLAMIAVWSGDPGAALQPLDSARSIYRTLDHAAGEQNALGQLVTARMAMGEYQHALAMIDTALAHARQHDLAEDEADNLRLLGGLLADLGDGRRALRHLGEAAERARELHMDAELGSVLRRAAMVHASLGAHSQALADAQAALATHRASGDVFDEIDDLIAIADIQRGAGAVTDAAATLRSARVLAEQLQARRPNADVALAEARLYQHQGRHSDVLRAAARARAALLHADFAIHMEASTLAARAYHALGQADSAAISGLAAVHALERVRADLASSELRGTFVASAAEAYGLVVLTLLQLGRAEEAFAIADAARSRELLQQLTSARPGGAAAAAGRQAGPAPAGQDFAAAELLLRRIDALLDQLRSLENEPPDQRGPGAESSSSEIIGRIARLRDEYESLQIRSARSDPRSARLLGVLRLEDARVRAAVGPGEALLHYTLLGDRVVVFVARADRLETVQVSVPAADVASRIRLLRELWGVPAAPATAGMPAARGLHEVLVAPVQRAGLLADVRRLVIVPHGILEQLPFAALQDAATGRFLVEDYDIGYAPSANALVALREAGAGGAGVLPRVNAFAPLTATLPATRAEAESASRTSPGGSLQVDRRATEQAVRRALADSAVVHIASHGVLNSRNPMFSRMELARGARGSSADDGRLEVHEVLRMRVNSPLVVLSGCETGAGEDWSGDPLRGSGVTTLAQAFLQAGARNVMATLWRVDDVASADLVSRFYREAASADPVRALSMAQRAMIRDTRTAAPYFWAGYVLLGESDSAPPRHTAAALTP